MNSRCILHVTTVNPVLFCTHVWGRRGEDGGSQQRVIIYWTQLTLWFSLLFFFGFAFVSSFLTQCQHHHVQVIRRWCQRSHPPPDVRRGTRVSQHQRQLQVLCCQSGRLGRQEARVGAIGKTWLWGEWNVVHAEDKVSQKSVSQLRGGTGRRRNSREWIKVLHLLSDYCIIHWINY